MNLSTRLRDAIDDRAFGHSALDLVDALPARRLEPRVSLSGIRAEPTLGRTPLVSVVIPCFNYGRFLEAAVGSVLRQREVAVEVIVVDDASTDDSADVADRIAAREPRVRVVRNAVNQGHVRTFNNGYERVTGEFVVRLDADDLLTPGSLARAVELFDRFPAVGLVYGHPRHFTTVAPPAGKVGSVSWSVWSGRDWLAERCRTSVNCITTPEAVVRASVMHDVGPLRTELRFAQDMEMWLRVSAVSDVGRVNGVDQALHRDHDASMSVNDGAGILTDLLERREVFRLVFEATGSRVTAADQLHDQAKRSLAAEALGRACHAYDRGRTGSEPVDDFVRFARETYPGWRELPEERALRQRVRAGADRARRNPLFVAAAVNRRLAAELAYVRWARQGI